MTQFLISDPVREATVTYVTSWIDAATQQGVVEALTAMAPSYEASGLRAPRLIAAFADPGVSGGGMDQEHPWPAPVATLRDRLAEEAGHPFNYAIVNWYRDGTDFVGWHPDKIDLHVPDTSIAILSLGAPRPLRFRAIADGAPLAEFTLASGSVLWMAGELQRHYEHSVPKDPAITSPRFSITFRNIL
ncbi:MAG: alpha-ketoglutarate-dependent dioxygenase AlkB [Solirubrobacteraceae bacterium]|nr:alpha-ketoglutarate-dependent dioxygenase AlkB [Patulibacter sp.]